jgi:asparagine synthase (glutamine-hydrolysing)
LSGGLDSSIVTTLARQVLPSLSTFTVGFEDMDDPYHGRSDESSQAEETARRLQTKHHTIRVTGRDFRAMLPDFCTYGDVPFAVSSGLGVMAVAREARKQGVKVLLTGDGADEAFGGYSWYFHLDALRQCKSAPQGNVSVSFQNVGLPLERRLDVMSGYEPPAQAWAWHYYAAESEKAALFSTAPFSNVASSLRHFAAYKVGAWDPSDYIRQDQAFYFPNEMLAKADRMTMACSVEGRIPFAAPAVQAMAKRIPLALLVRDGQLKWILRQAFANVVAPEVIARPKHGFNVPIDHWLKNDWADLLGAAFASSSALSRHGLLAHGAARKALAMRDDPQRLNGHTLFCYIMLDMWLDMTASWR